MGFSKADKVESHERIVEVASRLFREHGINGISVADLMQSAGLTHGGFYRHFGSRDDLVNEAIERALEDGSTAMNAIAANPRATIGALVDAYLSLAHRDNLPAGCAVSALASDIARAPERPSALDRPTAGRSIAMWR